MNSTFCIQRRLSALFPRRICPSLCVCSFTSAMWMRRSPEKTIVWYFTVLPAIWTRPDRQVSIPFMTGWWLFTTAKRTPAAVNWTKTWTTLSISRREKAISLPPRSLPWKTIAWKRYVMNFRICSPAPTKWPLAG